MMNDRLSNRICKLIRFPIRSTDGQSFHCRLKLRATDDAGEAEIDDFISPSTPLVHPGTFGAVEPAMNQTIGDVNIPLSDYKWNQIVEIQLPDGKKVRNSSPKE